jgi:hypothetical protein
MQNTITTINFFPKTVGSLHVMTVLIHHSNSIIWTNNVDTTCRVPTNPYKTYYASTSIAALTISAKRFTPSIAFSLFTYEKFKRMVLCPPPSQ